MGELAQGDASTPMRCDRTIVDAAAEMIGGMTTVEIAALLMRIPGIQARVFQKRLETMLHTLRP